MIKNDRKIIVKNKKAYHDYQIIETIEAGLILKGTEIKSIKNNGIHLRNSFVKIFRHEAFAYNIFINHYKAGNIFNHEPLRKRKLLLHKKQITRLIKETKNVGITIIPLQVYMKYSYAKLLIGISRGKQKHDKREILKRKNQEKKIRQFIKNSFS